jgi:WD40 repeat protein/serine/threonine protein kinase/tetratricopeptide (TPR) repeat protein
VSEQFQSTNTLPLELAKELEHFCNRFEIAWRSDTPPRIEDYLAEAPEAIRPALLRELILLEIYYLRSHGENCQAAAYRERFPAVGEEWLAEALAGSPGPTPEPIATSAVEPMPRADLGREGEAAAVPPASTEQPGDRIGPYKLLQKLGRGGMGDVWLAEQTEPVQRRVALKVIKPGMDSAQVIARFEQERQALAMMDHPNIAKVLEAGTTVAGRPYFVMDLVKGIHITRFCDQEHLTPRERLGMFVPVCEAVQHAHQKSIIHRDLKPSNVLVALFDGKPVPKVIDFGVAKATGLKLTERTLFTEVGQMIGTLEYMAPEQAELNNLDIDTRADIYALGVILYELITGSPPFTRAQLRSVAFTEMLRMIREVEPPKPSTKLSSSHELPALAAKRKMEPAKLPKLVHGDLDSIVMKALAKERSMRYQTANELALDISRYLRDEPVLAVPPGAVYHFRKFMRRNRRGVIAAALLLVALLAGFAGTAAGLVEARSQRTKAEELAENNGRLAESNGLLAESEKKERKRAEGLAGDLQVQLNKTQEESARLELNQALDSCRQGNVRHGLLLLAHALDLATKAEAADLQRAIRANLAVWRSRLPGLKAVLPHQGEVLSVAFSSDGTRLVTGSSDRTVQVWETATGKPIGKPIVPQDDSSRPGPEMGQVVTVAFSHDGRAILTGTGSGKSLMLISKIAKKTIRDRGWQPRLPGSGASAALSGDQNMPVRLWDATTGELLHPSLVNSSHEQEPIWVVAVSPDGHTILTGGGNLQQNDPRRDRVGGMFPGMLPRQPPGRVPGLPGSFRNPFNPAGPGAGGGLQFWDAATGRPLHPAILHDDVIVAAAFSPTGKWAVTGGLDGTARIWEVSTGKLVGKPLEHDGVVVAVAFSPDGRTVLTASFGSLAKGGTLRLWDPATGKRLRQPHEAPESVSALAFSPDGRTFLTGGGDPLFNKGAAQIWDAATGRPLGSPLPHQGFVHAVAFSPDGRSVLTASADKTARLWEATVGVGALMPLYGYENAVACRPDGGAILRGLAGKTVQLCEAATGKPLGSAFPYPVDTKSAELLSGGLALFSPDGRQVLVHDFPAVIGPGTRPSFQLREATTGKPIGQCFQPRGSVRTVVFSADGRLILTGTGKYYSYEQVPNEAQIWEAATGKPLLKNPLEHKAPIRAAAFGPSGRMVVTASEDQTARLWDTMTGKPIGQPLTHRGAIRAVAFSPDGRIILTGSDDGTGRVWETATGKPVSPLLMHLGPVRSVAFSPDSGTVVTGSDDHTARLWKAATGKSLGAALQHRGPVRAVAFGPDGSIVATGSYDGTVQLWETASARPIGDVLGHGGPVLDLVFSQDGSTLLARSWEKGRAGVLEIGDTYERPVGDPWGSNWTVWKLSGTLEGGIEQITLWAQTLTSFELDADGVINFLEARIWQQRRQRLQELGNPSTASVDSLTWHRQEAAAAEARGQWYGAAWHLQRLASAPSPQWQLHNRLGCAYIALRALDKALAETTHAIELGKEEWEPWYNRGRAYALQGQPEKALADFSEALKRDDKHWEPWHERGRVYARLEQWEKAAADLTKATTLPQDPGTREGLEQFLALASAEAWADLALVCLHLNDTRGYMKACAYLRLRCGRTSNLSEVATVAWISALSPNGSPNAVAEQHVELAQRAAVGNPGDYRILRALGASLYRAGQLRAAVQQFNAALTARKQPAPSAWLFLAMTHHGLGQQEEAQRWLAKSVQWIEQARQAKPAPGTNQGVSSWSKLPWTERLALELLRREAEALVNPKTAPARPNPTEQKKPQAKTQ